MTLRNNTVYIVWWADSTRTREYISGLWGTRKGALAAVRVLRSAQRGLRTAHRGFREEQKKRGYSTRFRIEPRTVNP